eukprot:COSAG05_NODE_217_length_13794_cov_5.734064_8_plen_470_part_00
MAPRNRKGGRRGSGGGGKQAVVSRGTMPTWVMAAAAAAVLICGTGVALLVMNPKMKVTGSLATCRAAFDDIMYHPGKKGERVFREHPLSEAMHDLADLADSICDAATQTEKRKSDKSAVFMEWGRMLHHVGQRRKAARSIASGLHLLREHLPLAKEIARMEKRAEAKGDRSLTGTSKLIKLWPVENGDGVPLPEWWREGADDGPAAFPFELVSTEPGSTPSARPWFTPVWFSQADSEDLHVINHNIFRVIEKILQATDFESELKSNIGGWQSLDPQRFLQEHSLDQGEHGAAIRALHLFILQQVSEFLSALGVKGEPSVSIDLSWANLNQKGNWNKAHVHGRHVDFAGAYYVSSGLTPGKRVGGLRITDPRPDAAGFSSAQLYTGGWYNGTTSLKRPPGYSLSDLATDENSMPIPAQNWPVMDNEWTNDELGQAGTLALWPGYLSHWVPQHEGSQPRISIAFNVHLTLG